MNHILPEEDRVKMIMNVVNVRRVVVTIIGPTHSS